MKQFTYIIQDNVGIHARPAGLLAKAAKALDSVVTVEKADGKSAAATKLTRPPALRRWSRFSNRICKRQICKAGRSRSSRFVIF